jgi:hypothetical protein
MPVSRWRRPRPPRADDPHPGRDSVARDGDDPQRQADRPQLEADAGELEPDLFRGLHGMTVGSIMPSCQPPGSPFLWTLMP